LLYPSHHLGWDFSIYNSGGKAQHSAAVTTEIGKEWVTMSPKGGALMNDWPYPPDPSTFRHHWVAFAGPLSVVALLLVAGLASMLFSVGLGLVLWAVAVVILAGTWQWREWHTLTFTVDNRLLRRRGPFGLSRDLITLFGVISPTQTPILGPWLDVGDVHLGIPGPDIHIRQIEHFEAFCQRLIAGAQPQREQEFYIYLQMPDSPNGWRGGGGTVRATRPLPRWKVGPDRK
jgi:hypothetical protein